MKNDYYKQYVRTMNFVERVEDHTSNFDEFCDCGEMALMDKNRTGCHEQDCMTMLWRRDLAKLEEENQNDMKRNDG